MKIAVQLLEREAQLARLSALLAQAESGRGACVLLSGEAGIGKTALLDVFTQRLPLRVIRLLANCDPLQAPRPLGVLADIAPVLMTAPSLVQGATDRSAVFDSMLAALARLPRTAVMICEDVHWADEASLDLLRLIARRVQRFGLLMVLSYRDDGLDAAHPLALLLGDLTGPDVHRLALAPLSLPAVERLVADSRSAGDAATLHRLSAGNPFFVSELIASAAQAGAASHGALPPTVRDAVQARLLRLSASVREMVQVASLEATRCEWSLLEHLFGDAVRELRAAATGGLLVDEGAALRFRHELGRQAVVESLSPSARQAWHRRTIEHLAAVPDAAPARLAEHALRSGDAALVRRWGMPAAAQAERAGASREAAQLYSSLLAQLSLAPAERAPLYEAWSRASHRMGDVPAAIAAREQALRDRIELGEVEAEGDNLRWLARLHWLAGNRGQALALSERALQRLSSIAPSVALAWAMAIRAGLHMTAEEDGAAIDFAQRAVDLGVRLGDIEVQIHALNTLGDAQQYEAPDWREKLERSLALALAHRFVEHAGRAWSNLVSTAVVAGDYPTARRYAAEGIAFCSERDLDFWCDYLRAWLARVDAECGDFNAARGLVDAVLGRARAAPVARISVLIAQAALQLRRGAPESQLLIEQVWLEAQATGEHQRVAPVLALRVEAAWLAGDARQMVLLAHEGLADSVAHGSRDNAGLFAAWLVRAGERAAVDAAGVDWPQRFALEIDGRWPQAAAVWDGLGCRYRQALALLEGNADAVRAALLALEAIGAGPAARLARQRLQQLGEKVPRGPRLRTRDDALGLTPRERQILGLLAEGRSNAAIAASLARSTRTVEHHVARLLAKLGASNRAEAVRMAGAALPREK